MQVTYLFTSKILFKQNNMIYINREQLFLPENTSEIEEKVNSMII